ncbi:MAG TPA: diacylglycerol kinase family protein [Acidimicrobiia bacterium]|nr:diacylglycerol kinase family protein [Acidimicrobiia bacterium]
MTSVAVVAHSRKTLDGGLPELRKLLADAGVSDPIWYEVRKSKQAPARVRRAIDEGADLVFVWGGDGMVQRSIDALAGANATIAILPAGTANLLATNLGIPTDLAQAVDIGLHGDRRKLDVGVMNGERFAVMAGAGFDARMIRDADRGLKDKAGRLAYIFTGARNLRGKRVKVKVKVDGEMWFEGRASCVLFGNVGKLFGGLTTFVDARPDDGRLDLGVVTAEGALEWARALAQTVRGQPERSPFVNTTSGKRFSVRFSEPTVYELDGGDRSTTKKLKVRVEPGAVTVCVPADRAA